MDPKRVLKLALLGNGVDFIREGVEALYTDDGVECHSVVLGRTDADDQALRGPPNSLYLASDEERPERPYHELT